MVHPEEYGGRELIRERIADEPIADLIDRMMAMWNGGPTDEAGSIYATSVTLNGHPVGVEGLVASLKALRRAFPDQRFHVEDVIADGGRVFLRMMWSGTHAGEFVLRAGPTLPASGRPFSAVVLETYEVRDSEVVAIWIAWDSLMQALELGASLVEPTASH